MEQDRDQAQARKLDEEFCHLRSAQPRTRGFPSSVASVRDSSPLELPGVLAIDAGVPAPTEDTGLEPAPAAGLALADAPRGLGV